MIASFIEEIVEGKNVLKERLAVSIRINDQTEFLGISPIEKGTELAHKEAIKKFLKMYGVLEKIKLFDTTASNTGNASVKCRGLKNCLFFKDVIFLHDRKRKRKYAALPTEYKIKKGSVESNAIIN